MKNCFKGALLFVFSMFLFPLLTHAECDYQRISELSKIASNVQISYTYEFSDQIKYTVHITNLTDDLYILENSGNSISGSNDISIDYDFDGLSDYELGDTIEYNIYSNDLNCKDEFLLTKYITLPDYNHFALSDTCKNYPEFKYCSLWGYTNLDKSTFDSKFQSYLESIKNESTVSDSNKSPFDFKDFLKNNYIAILSGLAIIVFLLFIFLKVR